MSSVQAIRLGQRGIALITVLLALVLVLAMLAVMVDIGAVRLRRTNEDVHAAQALAAADAGAAWVRALLALHYGDLSALLDDLAKAHSTTALSLDNGTTADVIVSLQLPGAAKSPDHLDINLQENPQIEEAPLQIIATATITSHGEILARRTVTTLLRRFHHIRPYSEIVGVIDDAGPSSIFSPGDPAGQVGDVYATDLRMRAKTEAGLAADRFQDQSWSDGNIGSSGLLP